MKKKYISLTGIQYTFPVRIKGTSVWVSFKGNENDFVTSDEKIQSAIESHAKFRKGEIGLCGSTPEATDEVAVEAEWFEPAVFDEVTDINGMVEVLAGAPYKIAKRNLKKPDDICKAMERCNVTFPNLTGIND